MDLNALLHIERDLQEMAISLMRTSELYQQACETLDEVINLLQQSILTAQVHEQAYSMPGLTKKMELADKLHIEVCHLRRQADILSCLSMFSMKFRKLSMGLWQSKCHLDVVGVIPWPSMSSIPDFATARMRILDMRMAITAMEQASGDATLSDLLGGVRQIGLLFDGVMHLLNSSLLDASRALEEALVFLDA